MMMYEETFYDTTPATIDKSQNGLPLETKNTQNHESRRLGLIVSSYATL